MQAVSGRRGSRYSLAMVRKAARVFAWFLGTVFSLLLVAYAVLFVINLEDQPPSPDIAELLSARPASLEIADERNSYFFLLGFAGSPDAEPMALGLARHEWYETRRSDVGKDGDPLTESFEFRALRTEAVAMLAEACSGRGSNAECLRLLELDDGTVEQWIASEQWLLDRYRKLISIDEFLEPMPIDLFGSTPSYYAVFQGQTLAFADAWRSAGAGNYVAVREALETDLLYWRMVLDRSDALITKMIATAATLRHFTMSNLVLRRLEADAIARAIPDTWRDEISNSERSMHRSLAGEWMYFNETISQLTDDQANIGAEFSGHVDSGVWSRIAWSIFEPFWQPQDFSNRHARLLLQTAKIFNAPYENVPAAIDLDAQLNEKMHEPASRFYNLTGNLFWSTSYWGFSHYAVRVSDLEGMRRAALLTAELRAAGVATENVAEHSLRKEIRNPYTNEPFEWNDESGAIVYQGLEPHKRAKREFIY